jgi:hypothetical protein
LNNCVYTLAPPSIGQNGGRTYTISRNVTSCVSTNFAGSYSWSTLPAPLNPFVTATAAQAALFPTDFAWGIGNNGFGYRLIAVGNFINVSQYSNAAGQALGGTLTFTKQ